MAKPSASKKNAASYAPIAIVGAAFRFPGDITSEERFWDVLSHGEDMIGTIGPERWATDVLQHPRRSEPGTSITYAAGVLSGVDQFDAAFFDISPREAAVMDPQQRLLLELAWEATEDAGIPASRLAGSKASSFVGISSLDYGVRSTADLASFSAHTMTGGTMSIAANRIAYVFDLHGPSLSVDTACSSALVALHQACTSLHRGEASLAFVGSINLLLHPYPFVGFTKASMISADGRCKTFDASANGYVRAEGGAVLLLKPLAQAQADGDRIHAVIRGSGVNADGGRKTGLTIPSAEGQAELMRDVQKRAGITPAMVDYVEAHGTGTAVGDPIETRAIGEVYGKGRTQPLPIGSVKTNLGHLEAASGMAGLIKTMLMLQHDQLVPSCNLAAPNPKIDLDGWNLRVVDAVAPIAKPEGVARCMAINSFGFGGSNAHVILESAPSPPAVASTASGQPPLMLAAKNIKALQAMAQQYANAMDALSEQTYYDFAYSAAYHRDMLPHRLALPPAAPAVMAERLRAFARGDVVKSVVSTTAMNAAAPVAFVYTGNGAHWEGMARALRKESSAFAAHLAEVDALVQCYAGFSVIDTIEASPAPYDDTRIVQPVLFAIQVAITRLLRDQHGITPVAVTGHSVGEVAAAWAAGIFTLEEAVRLICARSDAQATTRGTGRMAAVAMDAGAMQALLADPSFAGIEIAGFNGPGNITISGDHAALLRLEACLKPQNIFFRLLDLDYAFHSAAMDPAQAHFTTAIGTLARSEGTIDFISTVTGTAVTGSALDETYWWDNIRKPVLFAPAISALAARGARIFLEIGPHAILQRYIGECLTAENISARVLPTLKRGEDGAAQLEHAALQVHLAAPEPDYTAYFPQAGRRIDLPRYPWQRERHWLDFSSESSSVLERTRVHPLLGWRVRADQPVWENHLDLAHLAYMADHQVSDTVVFPAAGTVEIVLAAARDWYGQDSVAVEDFEILSPMILSGEHACSIRVTLNPQTAQWHVDQKERLSDSAWTPHAVGKLLLTVSQPAQKALDHVLPIGGKPVGAAEHYALTERVGLEYGPAFQAFGAGTLYPKQLEGRFAVPRAILPGFGDYCLHPSLLDACFQTVVLFFREAIEAGHGAQFLPVKIGQLTYYSGVPTRFTALLTRQNPRSVCVQFTLYDADDRIVATLQDSIFRLSSFGRHAKKSLPSAWQSVLVPLTGLAANGQLHAHLLQHLEKAQRVQAQVPSYSALKETARPLLNALINAYAFEAFAARAQEDSSWLAQLVADSAAPYLRWLATMLMENELLHEDHGNWKLDHTQQPPPAQTIWQMLLAEFPGTLPQLVLIGRAGAALPSLLRGETQTDALWEQIRHSYFLEHWYDDSTFTHASNNCLHQAMEALLRDQPADCTVRLLFIAGHASAYAQQIAQTCEAHGVHAVIAQEESESLSRLQVEYQTARYVDVAQIDPQSGALTAKRDLPAQYDIVIVHHWLHQYPQRVDTLAQLLAPHGQLVLMESAPSYTTDFVRGLHAGWWHGTPHQPVSSLLDAATWEAHLTRAGFGEVSSITANDDTTCMLLATRPPAAATVAASETYYLLHDAHGFSYELALELSTALKAQGQTVSLHYSLAALMEYVHSANDTFPAASHVIYLRGLQLAAALPPSIARGSEALALVQHLATAAGQPRLWLVTAGGAPTMPALPDYSHQPNDAALWGEGRVMMNEYVQFDPTLIDIGYHAAPHAIAADLARSMLSQSPEREIILTRDAAYAPRIVPTELMLADKAAPTARYRLDFETPGQLRNLQWFPLAEKPIEDTAIEVAVAATGLNFRDVMYTMGMLPDEAMENGFSGPTLGLEFSGTITRTGKRVHDLKVGDAVMGFGPACFSSHVVTDADAVMKKPDGWSHLQAATVPTAFFTAYYALKYLADLQPGERVLIHGAAGGVGIAAIQIAIWLGAEVYATAGNDEKRIFARLSGAHHVFDSRSLHFADDVLAATDGEGVDVVLNSLAGEAINRNLRILKPFGRFLELGKRDYFENTYIGLRPFKSNISYFGIDADQLLTFKPRLAHKIFAELMGLFAAGTLTPLPHQSYPTDRVVNAFRSMQQSRHIGKIVVDMTQPQPVAAPAQSVAAPFTLHQKATYIVSGGVGGFGAETAAWLAAHGAGHLVLLSRRGSASAEAEQTRSTLCALGAEVEIHACDVTDAAQVEALMASIADRLPPVRGIVHAAMVLDDTLMQGLTAERMEQVFDPKARGAWNLHTASLGMPLDHFIVYSSITTMIGNPGQANYVAANSYLESLVLWRSSQNLPAHAVCWGPIADSGYLTRNTAVKEGLANRLGGAPLTSAEALAALPLLLQHKTPVITLANFSFAALERILPSAKLPRFDFLRRAHANGESDDTRDILAQLASLPPEEARSIITGLLLDEASKILSLSADRIQHTTPLHDLGMDSLMFVELALVIEQRFNLKLAAMELSAANTTIEQLGMKITQKLTQPEDAAPEITDERLAGLMQSIASQHASSLADEVIQDAVDAMGALNTQKAG